ncbi:putative amidohydrolase [Vulcanisaeta moutnovskia 768-28]|uniref:Amidohydrolase n=1 Tax=Vulcanisaeta moutnovskia (strain 768-28) TaxID=985053 RepID=F0QT56_VULM7|nr:amidohydrolase family protein [Vulcanisaeta moutnovskia]ADY01645.1 putative amidohydrolase [Vulcanisaeta moutnovskia 768-28]
MDKTDLIVRAKYVITMTNPLIIEDGAVAIDNGLIKAVGRASDVLSQYRGEEVINRDRHILMPGLIDTHTHTQQVLLRSFINDERLALPPLWTKLLIPFEELLNDELAYLSSLVSVIAMAKNGITYFIEAGAPRPRELIKAINEVGIRGVVTRSTFNVRGDKITDADDAIRGIEELLPEVNDRVRVWCSIRQVMMATEDLLLKVKDYCLNKGLGITYHLGEYQGEVDYALTKYGIRPLEVFDKLGLTLVRPTVIAHAVYLSSRERAIVRDRGLGIAWCPMVDSIAMGLHWLPMFNDALFGFGSDGGAFTSLDLLHETKIARAVGKALTVGITYDKSSFNSITMLRALTGWGGLLIGDNVGAIKEGFKADLITLRLNDARALPAYDPVESVVSFLDGHDVNDVLVGGRFIVRDGKLFSVSEDDIIEKLYAVMPIVNEKLNNIKYGAF